MTVDSDNLALVLLDRLLAVERYERFSSAGELLGALEGVIPAR